MLIAQDITVSYGKRGKEKIVLGSLFLEINTSKVQGVFGEKSSGKTTLAKVLSGDLIPLTGSVTLSSKTSKYLVSGKHENLFKLFSIFKGRGVRKENHHKKLKIVERKSPDILIVDDADLFSYKELVGLLEMRNKEEHLTILLSKDLVFLQNLSDDVLWLEKGRIKLPCEFFRD